jgi:hypothetical protein
MHLQVYESTNRYDGSTVVGAAQTQTRDAIQLTLVLMTDGLPRENVKERHACRFAERRVSSRKLARYELEGTIFVPRECQPPTPRKQQK